MSFEILPSLVLLQTFAFVSSYLFKDSEYKKSCFQSGLSSYKKSWVSERHVWHDANVS